MKCLICDSENLNNNIIKCLKCEHIFRNYPLINLSKYYSEEYRKTQDNQELKSNIYEKRNKFIIDKIKSYINETSSLFEVGFGYGHFYNILKKEMPKVKYSCCEISKPLAERNLRNKIATFNCSFQDIPESKFDVVASFDVLEHFYDPKKYVKKLKEVLKVGGISVIQVPTDRKIHFKKPFDGHYHYFSKKSLKHLLGEDFKTLMFYKTRPGETAGGPEFLTVFQRIK